MNVHPSIPPDPDRATSPRIGVVIVAAGASTRMGGLDKIWALVAGRPVIAWTLDAFERTPEIAEVVLVVAPDRLDDAATLWSAEDWQRVQLLAAGGERRRDSVYIGLQALSHECRLAVIHDGARPLVTPRIIERGLTEIQQSEAVSASEPVKETLKRVENGVVVETPERAHLALLQTPQIFDRARLLAAHAQLDPAADPADDATLAFAAGIPLMTFPGSPENLKITTPDDLAVVEALLSRRG